MAHLSFEKAYNNGDCRTMEITSPDKIYKGFFCDPKLDRSTMPEGWYAYDFRTDDEGLGMFCELCHNYVYVNNGGTFFTQTEIPELKEADSSANIKIDQMAWDLAHDEPNFHEDVDNPENAWDYTFE